MDKINFVNEPSGNTPLSAENLNQIQTNAENAINTKQKILTAGSNITIDDSGLISAEIKTPSTNVSSALYFDNANMKLVDITPTVAAKEITLSTTEQSIDYTLDIVTDNFVVSPTSLYNLYLALSGLSTVAGKKYIFRAEWKHGTTIISKSSTTTVEATASIEFVGLPMPNNLLEENLVLNTGDALTLTIYYKTNMGDGTISILNTADNQSAFVRNGTEVIANNVYDNFNGENHSQSYINHYLKENLASSGIIDSRTIPDKTINTYSARIIDENIDNIVKQYAGGNPVSMDFECRSDYPMFVILSSDNLTLLTCICLAYSQTVQVRDVSAGTITNLNSVPVAGLTISYVDAKTIRITNSRNTRFMILSAPNFTAKVAPTE